MGAASADPPASAAHAALAAPTADGPQATSANSAARGDRTPSPRTSAAAGPVLQAHFPQPFCWPAQADATLVAASAHLLAGGVVLAPTETFYGLLARADAAEAVAEVLRRKGRPKAKPLPLAVANLAHAEALASFTPGMYRLARAFWPGPLSLVLASAGPWPDACAEREATGPGAAPAYRVAMRVSGHPLIRALAAAVGQALTVTSANVSGEPPACKLADVRLLGGGRGVLAIDGGATPGGTASTLVREGRRGLQVLRAGAVAEAALHRAWA